MKSPHLKTLFAACLIVLLSGVPAFSQDADITSEPAVSTSVPAQETQPQVKETAIYGEVQAVDAMAGTLSVQYYDYDSDSEKTADIIVNIDTKLENASTLGDVKKGDWIDVTYVVNKEKNVAKVVTVEKEETPAPEETVSQTPAPASAPLEQ